MAEEHLKGSAQVPAQPAQPKAQQAGAGKESEIRYIVRIAGRDLNGNLPIYRALARIRGIGIRMAKNIGIAFEDKTGIGYETKLGDMPEDMDKQLEEIVLNPGKFGVPAWCLNRRNDWETGETKHIVMGDLQFQLRKDLQRLNEIKSYRGLRHSWGLPVRGQRTKSTHRGKGAVVGVFKKDAAKAAAPAAAAAGAKGAEKKEQKGGEKK
ncbi:MAG: 30S ribosomal protein S13 [Candidatus Diapherotrites archaeon]|nr:30S ribosomal protein S13 [Candidatus Diapherotrites archaeon]